MVSARLWPRRRGGGAVGVIDAVDELAQEEVEGGVGVHVGAGHAGVKDSASRLMRADSAAASA